LALLRTFYDRAFTMLKAPVLVNASTSTGKVLTREVHALAAVASVLFNLDSALTR
jgi:hypothetical protein